jgi:hypothetical protein
MLCEKKNFFFWPAHFGIFFSSMRFGLGQGVRGVWDSTDEYM